MADASRKAQRDEMLAAIEADFAAEDEVEALDKQYRQAQRKFAKSGTGSDGEAYKAAKQAFVERRNEQRAAQAASPYHPRLPRNSAVGVSSGTVAYDDGTTEEH
jgi:hypothetical protein